MIKDELHSRIGNREATVAVIGLGYVGTPLVGLVHEAGYAVEGIDRFMAEPPQALSRLPRFTFHKDYAGIADCDVVVICVPTPLAEDRTPDLSSINTAVAGLVESFRGAGGIVRPKLVVLESTTYPGTTNEVVKRELESAGFTLGSDFFLAYAPERVDPGQTDRNLKEIPRVVGGVDADSGELAETFYRNMVSSVHRVSSAEVAEMSKLLENVFRAVNIAMVNEISLLCRRMGIDIWEVTDAASTKPFGFMPFRPGPGMGGHCIPVDPFYLAWRAKQFGFDLEFIELAGKVNRLMPHHVVDWVVEALNRIGKKIGGAGILVVGVAYKEDVADIRESPALQVIELLVGLDADVTYCDSHVPSIEISGQRYDSVDLSASVARDADCILILTAHSDLDLGIIASANTPVVDTRNALGRGGS